MCLISVLPKGTPKYSDEVTAFIKSGFESNGDGSGFMYKRNGKDFISVNKGYFQLPLLMQAIKNVNLSNDDELVIHHRIGTAGLISAENTHPFIITNKHDDIIKLDTITSKPALVHNGMFRDLKKYEALNPDFSDTYAFTRYVMTNTIDLFKNETSIFEDCFKSMLGWSKICVLFPNRSLMMSGTFIQDNGYFHSTHAYKNNSIRDHGGQQMGFSIPTGNNNATQHCSIANVKKLPVGLNGDVIDITNFNCTHFTFKKKNTFGGKEYEMLSYDPEAETNVLEVNYGTYISTSVVRTDKLISDYEYIPKDEFKDFYLEYIMLVHRLTPSKNILKYIYKKLVMCRQSNIRTKFNVQKITTTRITMINYYMSLSKNIFGENSTYGKVNITKFVDFDVDTETEEVDNRFANFVLASADRMIEINKALAGTTPNTSKNEELVEL